MERLKKSSRDYTSTLWLLVYSSVVGITVTAITYWYTTVGLRTFGREPIFRGAPAAYFTLSSQGAATFNVALFVLDVGFWMAMAFVLMFVVKSLR